MASNIRGLLEQSNYQRADFSGQRLEDPWLTDVEYVGGGRETVNCVVFLRDRRNDLLKNKTYQTTSFP